MLRAMIMWPIDMVPVQCSCIEVAMWGIDIRNGAPLVSYGLLHWHIISTRMSLILGSVFRGYVDAAIGFSRSISFRNGNPDGPWPWNSFRSRTFMVQTPSFAGFVIVTILFSVLGMMHHISLGTARRDRPE
jgi:hypothetical protein